ncbi:MAG: hypothetical protein AB1898_21740 [Acidobacteriota bacterium]
MKQVSQFCIGVCVSALSLGLLACSSQPPSESPQPAETEAPARQQPTVALREAPLLKFPATVDCNSPAHWDGERLYVFNSAPVPWRSDGPSVLHLANAAATQYDNKANGGRWIEATYKDDDGTLYGWYHNEPHPVCSNKESLTAPRIGAAVSQDNGATWKDLGFVLEAPDDSLYCETANHYFAGGNGDFCVNLDSQKQYFYFFISTYHKDTSQQGVSVARLPYAERKSPAGKALKWYRDGWTEPGIGGQVSPILPVKSDWNRVDADAFWGASIHWNTHLNRYVMLLNRAIDKDWKQEGIYISFNARLDDPSGWTAPHKILDREQIVAVPEMGPGWYPQVIGTDSARRETDKLAGRVARLFVHGKSVWEVVFSAPGEAG